MTQQKSPTGGASARDAEPRPGHAAGSDESSSAAGLTVLVVEDHDFQRRALVHLMRSLGACEVLEAGDGAEALAALTGATNAVDLILCDLDMPTMDGMEFMRHLGAADSPAAVIIASAHESNVINSVQIMSQLTPLRVNSMPSIPTKAT